MTNVLKVSGCLLTRISSRNVKNCIRLFSSSIPQTKLSEQELDNENSKLTKEFDRLAKIRVRTRTKEPQKPPFAKNLFLGVFDTDILAYPELNKEDQEFLDCDIQPLTEYYAQIVGRQKSRRETLTNFFTNLRNLNVFGLQSSQEFKGRNLSLMEACKFNDILYSKTETAPSLLHNEYLGIKALSTNGTPEQQKKYLSRLIAGDFLSAFCLNEKDCVAINNFKTKAILDTKQNCWVLNGEKCAVVNGSTANLMVVIAQTNDYSSTEKKITAFLVERSFEGITLSPYQNIGSDDLDVADVKFENVRVPAANVLGEPHMAEFVLKSITTEFRIACGLANTAVLRKVADNMIHQSIFTNSKQGSISETEFCHLNITKAVRALYAAESMIYMTASLVDYYEKQDCELEAAITKVFCSEQATSSALDAAQSLGGVAYSKQHYAGQLYINSLAHSILSESNSNLKIIVALLGVHHVGQNTQEKIRMIRNPFFFPTYAITQVWHHYRQSKDNPRLTLHLYDYLHPSLIETAKTLEYSVFRLQYATHNALVQHGSDIANRHATLLRLADCIIDIYAMTAVLSRASRSYCIGLQNANYEMVIASSFCAEALQRVKENVTKICDGPYLNNDENNKFLGSRAFKTGSYYIDHPLTRNY